MTRLRFVTTVNPSKAKVRHLSPDTLVTFAPMELIADGLGGLDVSTVKQLGDVSNASYSYFSEGDLLLAKVTPCFENGKKAIASGLTNGIGFATSEVHVIRPNAQRVDGRYLQRNPQWLPIAASTHGRSARTCAVRSGECPITEEPKARSRLATVLDRAVNYLFCSEEFRSAAMATMSGTGGLRRISDRAVLDYHLPISDLVTQIAIADFLDRETDRIDQLIEKKLQLLSLLALRQQALLESLVKGQLTPGLEMRASGIEWIGQVPAHWPVPRVNQVARLESGHTPSRSEERYWIAEECTIPWFTLGDIWQVRQEGRVFVSSTQEKISPIGMANSAARLLPADTVILSRTASVGFPAILCVPMATTQDFVNWISGPQLRPKYLYYVFRAMRREFDRLMIGSTHKTIYMPDVHKFSTPLPPLIEQDEIVRRLDQTLEDHEQLVIKTESTVVILREYRASLITAAVTGQLDITAWHKRGETERRLESIEVAV